MGNVVQMPVSGLANEVEDLIEQAESAGFVLCLVQDEGGDIAVAFEAWPSNFTHAGITAANALIDRFRDGGAFREALISYAWNVGATFVAGHFQERRAPERA